MQVSVEKSSELERRVVVEVPEDRIADQVKDRLEELRKTVRLDGFRQGRAPFSVVRQRFGKRVREEIVGEVLQSSFSDALQKESLRPAGQPVIDPVAADPGAGLTYTATFEVFPEITIKPLSELEIVRAECDIGDADIDQMIERLRAQNREWVAVERASAEGDQLEISFEGRIDGEVFEGGTGEDINLELGSGMMIDGFEAGLTGVTAGEAVNMDLKFPDDYRNEALAGKPVTFDVTVKKVSEAVLPELDEAFLEKFGVRGGDMAAFREEVRSNMGKERDHALRQRLVGEVTSKLAEANTFEVPRSLVDSEAERLRQQLARDLLMRGINPDDAPGGFEESVRNQAGNRVKLGLLMAEIIKDGDISANPDQVRERIEQMASSYEDAAAVVKWYYDNPEQLQQVEGQVLEDAAVNWVVDQARVTTESVTFDALMNPVQTDDNPEASS